MYIRWGKTLLSVLMLTPRTTRRYLKPAPQLQIKSPRLHATIVVDGRGKKNIKAIPYIKIRCTESKSCIVSKIIRNLRSLIICMIADSPIAP